MCAASLVLAVVWDEREELIGVCKAGEDHKDRSGDECDGDENATPAQPVFSQAKYPEQTQNQ